MGKETTSREGEKKIKIVRKVQNGEEERKMNTENEKLL